MAVMVEKRTGSQGSAADFDQQLELLVRKMARGDASPDDFQLYEELSLRKSLRMSNPRPTPPRRNTA